MPKEPKPKKTAPKPAATSAPKPSKPAKPSKPTAVKSAVAEPVAVKKSVTPPKPKAVKTTKPSKSTLPAPEAKVGFSREDVATRAYYLSERRRFAGLPGSEEDDWLQAERELGTGSVV